jgi:hypothetical protein
MILTEGPIENLRRYRLERSLVADHSEAHDGLIVRPVLAMRYLGSAVGGGREAAP